MDDPGRVTDLSGDVSPIVARRRFLGLLGLGAAASSLPSAAWATLHEPDGTGRGPWRDAREFRFEDPPVVLDDPQAVLLDQNENPLAPSAAERRALTEALDLANRYPDGERELVDRLAAYHGVQAGNILMGCGSTELLKVCADAVSAPGLEMVQATPTYGTIDRYARVRGAEVVEVPVDRDGRVDTPGISGRLSPRTRLVYLCNPNNPTGAVIPDAEVQEVIRRAGREVLVVVDEAYHDFVDDASYRSVLQQAAATPNLVVLRTFSKVFGLAGMRIGYAIASRDTIRRLSPHRLILDLNNPAIHAAMAALQDRAFYADTIRMNRDSRERILKEMPRFGGRPIPSQAGFVWIDMGRRADPIRDALRQHHVYVRTYPHSPDHLRISTGRAGDMDRLFTALEAVTAGRTGSRA